MSAERHDIEKGHSNSFTYHDRTTPWQKNKRTKRQIPTKKTTMKQNKRSRQAYSKTEGTSSNLDAQFIVS